MSRPQLAPVPRPESEVLAAYAPAAARSSGTLAAIPKPAVAVGGIALGALLLRLLDVVDTLRRERRLEKRKREAGPLIAIVSERIQIDFRTRRRRR